MTSSAHPATATAATPLHPLALAAQGHRRPHQSADVSNPTPLSATFPSLPLPLSSYNTNGQLAGPLGCSFKSPPQVSNTSTRRHRSIRRDHGQLAGPSTSGIPFEATTQSLHSLLSALGNWQAQLIFSLPLWRYNTCKIQIAHARHDIAHLRSRCPPLAQGAVSHHTAR